MAVEMTNCFLNVSSRYKHLFIREFLLDTLTMKLLKNSYLLLYWHTNLEFPHNTYPVLHLYSSCCSSMPFKVLRWEFSWCLSFISYRTSFWRILFSSSSSGDPLITVMYPFLILPGSSQIGPITRTIGSRQFINSN